MNPFIPSWAKDPKIGYRTINARAETIATAPAFRAAFQTRRCLVVADGFYEWQKLGKAKQPFHIRPRDGGPLGFAGLWEWWRPKEGDPVQSCTIITTTPNELMAPIHDRMPVILSPESYTAWLDPGARDLERLHGLLVPCSEGWLTATPVSTYVNSPRNQGPECVEPVVG